MVCPFDSLKVSEKLRPAITLPGGMTLNDVWQYAIDEMMTANKKIVKRSWRMIIFFFFYQSWRDRRF